MNKKELLSVNLWCGCKVKNNAIAPRLLFLFTFMLISFVFFFITFSFKCLILGSNYRQRSFLLFWCSLVKDPTSFSAKSKQSNCQFNKNESISFKNKILQQKHFDVEKSYEFFFANDNDWGRHNGISWIRKYLYFCGFFVFEPHQFLFPIPFFNELLAQIQKFPPKFRSITTI